jgi:hypothetical protein
VPDEKNVTNRRTGKEGQIGELELRLYGMSEKECAARLQIA